MYHQLIHQIHLALNSDIPSVKRIVPYKLTEVLCFCRTIPRYFASQTVNRFTHLHLPFGQPLITLPLVNVIRVPGLEGYSLHGPLT